MREHPQIPKNMYRVVLALFAGLMLLPFFQELTGLFPGRPLKGVEVPGGKVEWSWDNWKGGGFQTNFEQRHYQWMGLRSSLVRMENQLDYSLFGRLFDQTRVGKSGELFRNTSFRAETGRDYIGQKQIDYHSNHTTYLQQFLLQKGIRLLPVLTPTKLSCMPLELETSTLKQVDSTNREGYLTAFGKYQLDFLDLRPNLKRAVANDPHRVFPKTGSHWTDYGASLGFKAILEKMSQSTGLDYVDFSIVDFEQSERMRGTDADAGDLLNLWVDIPATPVDYPKLAFSNSSSNVRPRVLVISDSFWWKIYDQELHQNVFAPGSQFRYYNWEVYSDQWQEARTIDNFDLRTTIESVDWIVLCANEANLHKFPFGFVDQALEAFGIFQ